MLRTFALGLLGASALAGCAVTNTPYPRADGAYNSLPPAPPAGPNIYTNAARAPLHGELFACGNWGSNIGEIGARGETMLYTPYIYTPAGVLLRNPTEAACLSSGFGWRGSATGGGRLHNGLDLANREGGFIYAAGEGRVAAVGARGGYGNIVEIDHGHSVFTFYAHLDDINPNLREGSRVAEGEPIGRMGMTGNATGVHLHYEVSIDGILIDPLQYGRDPPPVL